MELYKISVMAVILDIYKLADFRTQPGKSIRGCSEKKLRRSDEHSDWSLPERLHDLDYTN